MALEVGSSASVAPRYSRSSPKARSPTATPVPGQQTPLLPLNEHDEPADARRHLNQDENEDDEPARAERAAQARNKFIWRLCFIIFALVQAANVVLQPPLAQLKELSSCMSYYGPGWSLGRDCKAESVQTELETLGKWQQLLDTAPGEKCLHMTWI